MASLARVPSYIYPAIGHYINYVDYVYDHIFQGSKNKCFPSSADDYYNERANGNNNRICNTDYNTMNSGNVPTYWRAMECGDDLHIGEFVT